LSSAEAARAAQDVCNEALREARASMADALNLDQRPAWMVPARYDETLKEVSELR
jgi:hypothetical protein